MAIDITNHHIGIALAYHQPQSLSNESTERYNKSNVAIATSITALPPIPYMSKQPYHPSYAFLNHCHNLTDEAADIKSTRTYGFDRVKRTMEIADQLALLAKDRKVKGILVRWPGDLASAVSGGGGGRGSYSDSLSVESTRRETDEGSLLFRSAESDNRLIGGTTASAEGGMLRNNSKSDGSMGYMRGRILYVLDKCTAYHGRSKMNARSLEPLLVEKTRPFAFFDTSITEQHWIVPDRKRASTVGPSMRHIDLHPLIPTRREDKYGNSFTEADLWGRCPVFGNQPPRPQQGKHYYSSREKYSGYRVLSHFLELGNIDGDGGDGEKECSNSRLVRNDNNFDNLHDDDLSRMLDQFQGSLSAMHALYDFANENLRGRIALPSWALSSSVSSFRTSHQGPLEQNENVVGYHRTTTSRRIEPGQPDVDASYSSSASTRVRKSTTIDDDDSHRSTPTRKSNNVLATLVQTNKRKHRAGKGKHEVNLAAAVKCHGSLNNFNVE